MRYSDSEAFRAALEARLRQAATGDQDLARRRRTVAFDRLLARLAVRQGDAWILKGGAALEFRMPDRARATRDIDLAFADSADPADQLLAPSTFATKGDAGRWLAKVQAGIVDANVVAAQRDGERLRQYAARWMEHRPLKPRTRELYESQLRRHIFPALGDAKVDRIEPRHIREWHAGLSGTGLSDVTVAKVYRLLRSILATAVDDKLLASNPCQIRSGGVERSKERPIPTLDQYQAIYRALPDDLAAVAALAAFAGLRKGEILGLRRQDIDLEARTVRVEGALQEVTGRGAVLMEPKTASSRRTVALPGLLGRDPDQPSADARRT